MSYLTFTNCADATPGAIVLANPCGGAGEVVALGTSEMNFMSHKVFRAKLGTKRWGSQRGAGGGSCRRGKERIREMQVTCGVSLPTSSGILRLGIYTCHWAARLFQGKRSLKSLIYSHTATSQQNSSNSQVLLLLLCCVFWNAWIIHTIMTSYNISIESKRRVVYTSDALYRVRTDHVQDRLAVQCSLIRLHFSFSSSVRWTQNIPISPTGVGKGFYYKCVFFISNSSIFLSCHIFIAGRLWWLINVTF